MRGSYKSTKGTKRTVTVRRTSATPSVPMPARRTGPVPRGSATSSATSSGRKTTSISRSNSRPGEVQAGGRPGITTRLTGRALANTRNKGQQGRLMSGRGKPTTSKAKSTPRPAPKSGKGRKRASGRAVYRDSR